MHARESSWEGDLGHLSIHFLYWAIVPQTLEIKYDIPKDLGSRSVRINVTFQVLNNY